MRSRRVTIKDVAKEAGVSVATASEALNGKGRVAALTRQNVIDAAARLKYSPSRTAKNLLAGRTGNLIFGVSPMIRAADEANAVQPEWDIEYYFRVFSAASARSFASGFLLSMLPFHATSHDFLSSTDGLIVVDPEDDDALLESAVRRGIPSVTVGRNSFNLKWTDNDFAAGTTIALNHLAPATPALFLSDTTSSYVRDELTSYLNWCTSAGIAPSLIHSPGPSIAEAEPVIFEALQDPNRRFDAVVSTLDTLAIAVERSAQRLGLRVPDDLQIMSLTDGRYFDIGTGLSITALDLHPQLLGEEAVDLLIALIEGATDSQRKLVPASLKARASTRNPTN